MTKAIRSEGTDLRRGVDWVLSRRGFVNVYQDRISCGDWTVNADDVEDAILVTTRDILFPVKVLIVQTKSETFQFGLNPWCGIANHLPFSYREEQKPIKWSLFSIVFRVGFVAYVIYWLVSRDN